MLVSARLIQFQVIPGIIDQKKIFIITRFFVLDFYICSIVRFEQFDQRLISKDSGEVRGSHSKINIPSNPGDDRHGISS